MSTFELKRMREGEEEKTGLNPMFADLALENNALKAFEE